MSRESLALLLEEYTWANKAAQGFTLLTSSLEDQVQLACHGMYLVSFNVLVYIDKYKYAISRLVTLMFGVVLANYFADVLTRKVDVPSHVNKLVCFEALAVSPGLSLLRLCGHRFTKVG